MAKASNKKPPTPIVKAHQPCIGCASTDAMNIHKGGDAHCWSCKRTFSKKEVDEKAVSDERTVPSMKKSNLPTVDEIAEMRSTALNARKISKEVMEFFGVKVGLNSDGVINRHFYPIGNGYKMRITAEKKFVSIGDTKGLFGMDKFIPGGKRLVITTGELDAMSVAEAYMQHYKRIYPIITMGSDAMTDRLLEARDFIRSFDEVILLFDQDASGEQALQKAIPIVGVDKVKIGKMLEKDPSDVLVKHGFKALMNNIFEAQPYIPGGILGRDELWERLEEYNKIQSIPFPECLQGVNAKTKGKRYGEITLFISGTGSGKSTVLREDAIHTLATTEDKIGWLAFEEGPAESARKMAGMVLNKNPADEEIPLEELRKGFDMVFGEDRVMVLDHQGSMSDESISDKLEYMCLSGCRHIYIDHITILVSEGVEGLHGNEAQDKIMNDLLRLVKRYPVWIGLVSHLRKVPSGADSFEGGTLPSLDDIRGSGSIKQISMDIIAFTRNMSAEDEFTRNKLKMAVLKCRYTGLTGPCDGARYDFKTGRLNAVIGEEEFKPQEMKVEEDE